MSRTRRKGKKPEYKFRNTNRAIIYLRVSSEEQAKNAHGLESQRSACERLCKERTWIVEAVFCDPGASGWANGDRPQFLKMMEFIRKDPNVNLVFYDYSRFFRDTRRALNEFIKLDELGIYSVSVCNQSIDCRTAAGRTARREELSKAEDFSDTHSEKQRERMRVALMERHTFTCAPSLGYRNVPYAKKGEPNIEPHEPAFSLMQKSFELIETGNYNLSECVREMRKHGLRTRGGKEMTVGQFSRMLRNPVYIGKIPSKRYGTQPGIHQPCVSEATFRRVQLILDGKKPTTSSYRKNREDLPLRQFLKCPDCGLALTGSDVTNKYGKTYRYYWCTCKFVYVRADKAHKEFTELLQSLRFDAPLSKSFIESLRASWEEKHGDSAVIVGKLKRELDELLSRREKLIFKYVEDDPHIRSSFPELKAMLDKKIELLETQIAESQMARATFDELQEFAQKMPSNLGLLWEEAPVDLKQKVQNTLFLGGLKYDPEKGLLNSNNRSTFNQLKSFFAGKLHMVDPVGIEPTTCRLRVECSAS